MDAALPRLPPALVLVPEGDDPVSRWLRPWGELCRGPGRVLFLNRFGCCFLQRPDGRVEMLDAFYGQLEPIAATSAEFARLVEDPCWREVYLLSEYVSRLHRAGKNAAGVEVYALAPPPLAGGPDPWSEKLPVEAAMVMDVEVLQELYAHHARTAREA